MSRKTNEARTRDPERERGVGVKIKTEGKKGKKKGGGKREEFYGRTFVICYLGTPLLSRKVE